MVVVPLLMIATNALKGPEEGPFASALINTARSLAVPVGTGLLELVERWRGAFHSERLVDQVGRDRFQPMSSPTGLATGDHGESLAHAVERQVSVLTTADTFLVLAAVGVVLALLVLLLPVRTYPPRILFAKH